MSRAEFRAMGTTVSLLLPEAQLQVGTEATQELFAEWEQTLSRFLPDSELSRLNRSTGVAVNVSGLLLRVLQAACLAAQETEGLFDPTLLPQLVQSGYDRTFEGVPTVMPATNYTPQSGGAWRGIRLNSRRRRVTLPQGVSVEVGGIAKGMAVDAAIVQLRLLGIQTALVNAGGDLAVMGLPTGCDSWPLTIAGKNTSWIIPFHHGALATSGIDRRHWQQGSHYRHHLIDPRSGESSQSGLWSVTVAAGDCKHAEVAAKVAFLLGAEQGRNFLEDSGLAGVLIRQDGSWTHTDSWPVALMKEREV
jgi:thiamine biosynthesis lipoprotein